MPVFSFDVTLSTHDLLKQRPDGITEAHYNSPTKHHRIVVSASSRTEAALTAAQMVCCYAICTGVYDRI